MSKYFSFEVQHIDKYTGARAGVFHTPHGDVLKIGRASCRERV